MNNVNSKHNGRSQGGQLRKKNDYQKLSNLGVFNLNNSNFQIPKSNGTGQLKPGALSVALTTLLLFSMFVPGASASTAKTCSKERYLKNAIDNKCALSAEDSVCVISNDVVENGLALLTMKQLIDSKVQIDPRVPVKFHKDFQCEKVKDKLRQTLEVFPTSEAHIKRVLREPEFAMLCTTPQKISLVTETAAAFFSSGTKAIYVNSDDLNSQVISHEFIHADHFFRHINVPSVIKSSDVIDAFLPFYPASKEKIKQYKEALDKGDQRISDFLRLRQKIQKKEKLSQPELERLDNYQAAAQDCLHEYNFNMDTPADNYDYLRGRGWKPGGQRDFSIDIQLKSVISPTNFLSLTVQILDAKQGPKYTHLALQPALVDVVALTTEKVQSHLLKHPEYSEKHKLCERDAHTFEALSDNAIRTFYPEAHALRKYNPNKKSI